MRRSFYTCFDVWVTIVIENLHSDCKMMKNNKWHVPFLIFMWILLHIHLHKKSFLIQIHKIISVFRSSQKFVCRFPSTFRRVFLKTLCPYCFMEKCMSLHHFLWQFIFLFDSETEYCIKKCVGRLGEGIRFLSRTDYNYLLCFLKIAFKVL